MRLHPIRLSCAAFLLLAAFSNLEPAAGDTVYGKISDMVAVDNPRFVYALDQDYQSIHVINCAEQQIVDSILYPYTQPLAAAYSKVDNKLYMVSKFEGKVVVYDLETTAFSEFQFSSAQDGVDIDIAPRLRRIYVIADDAKQEKLYILDMDTGKVLFEGDVEGNHLAVAENKKMLYTAFTGGSYLYRYSVANDQLELKQGLSAGSNGRMISLSPDSASLVFPCGGGNGYGYTIFDFDTNDLRNVRGEWDVGTYPKYARFSPDGSILYGVCGTSSDQQLHIMYAHDYYEIRALPFPNCHEYTVFTPNSDGSMVVGFSYDYYSGTDHQLYFFDDVQPPSGPNPHPLGIVSDMTAVSDPRFVYALDQDYKALYRLNTIVKVQANEFMVPHTQPVAMDYSEIDRSLYIASRFSGCIDVFDMDNQRFSGIDFSYLRDGIDIAVAPGIRRIYLLATDDYHDAVLFIIDMDSGRILLEEPVEGDRIVVDESRHRIFTGELGSSSNIHRYSVMNDELILEQYIKWGGNGRMIEISHDGEHIVYPCGGGNGAGYTVYDFDADDLNNVFGEWDIGTYPKHARSVDPK